MLTFRHEQPIPQAVVAASRYAADLPSDFTTLLTDRSNGGYVDTVAPAGNRLIGVRAIFGAGRSDSLDLDARNDQMRGRLPDPLVAVAEAEGGNLVCLSRTDGSVWFWDHELELTGGAAGRVADSWTEFVTSLAPIPAPEPDPEARAWADPAFLARLRREGC